MHNIHKEKLSITDTKEDMKNAAAASIFGPGASLLISPYKLSHKGSSEKIIR